MSKYYSASTGGFYSEDVSGSIIPSDSVEITDEEWQALLEGQSSGKRITADADGRPELTDLPGLTDEQKISAAKQTRDEAISSATAKLTPTQTKLLLGLNVTDAEKKSATAIINYITQLNAIDVSKPDDITWPEAP